MSQTWRDFPDFYASPVIQDLQDQPRWTISDKDKRPIDMHALIDEGRIAGAQFRDDRCLVNLPEVLRHVPGATNHAFFLSWQIDEYMVIDIEKTCPPEISASLLRLPYLYGELSLSQRGYHLVMPVPKNVGEFPEARTKKALQHPQKHYEILLEHYVTFTRIPLRPEDALRIQAVPEDEVPTWEDVYADLAQNAVPAEMADIDIDYQHPDLPLHDEIIELAKRYKYPRTLDDFSGDHSRFEFGMMAYLYNSLSPILATNRMAKVHEWTPSDKAWLIYDIVTSWIPWRPKHDEIRNDMPLLLNTAMSLTAMRAKEEEEKEKNS